MKECHDLHHFGLDLTGAMGNKETADTYAEKLGSDGLCSLMENHQQSGNSMPLLFAAVWKGGTTLGMRSLKEAVLGYSHPGGGLCV